MSKIHGMYCGLLFVFILAGTSLSDDKTTPVFAIINFQDNSIIADENTAHLKTAIPSLLFTILSETEQINLVERKQLSKIFNDLALEQSGMVSEESGIKVAKLTGARYLILGSFILMPDKKLRIDSRIVRTETAEIIKAEEISDKYKNLGSILNKLSKKILKNLQINLTREEEHRVNRALGKCKADLLLSFSKALSLYDQGNSEQAQVLLNQILDECPEFHSAKNLLYHIQKSDKKSD